MTSKCYSADLTYSYDLGPLVEAAADEVRTTVSSVEQMEQMQNAELEAAEDRAWARLTSNPAWENETEFIGGVDSVWCEFWDAVYTAAL